MLPTSSSGLSDKTDCVSYVEATNDYDYIDEFFHVLPGNRPRVQGKDFNNNPILALHFLQTVTQFILHSWNSWPCVVLSCSTISTIRYLMSKYQDGKNSSSRSPYFWSQCLPNSQNQQTQLWALGHMKSPNSFLSPDCFFTNDCSRAFGLQQLWAAPSSTC